MKLNSMDQLPAFQDFWSMRVRLLRNYFELVAPAYQPDPVKQDDLWDAFCDYFRSQRMQGETYRKFRDGTDMDRADVLDRFLLERTNSGATFVTS